MTRIKKKHCIALMSAMINVRPDPSETKKYAKWLDDVRRVAEFIGVKGGVPSDRYLKSMVEREIRYE